MLNQILNNLLSNAIKFHQRGRIHITVEIQEQTTDTITLAFTVTDTGMGIPAESIGYIFDSFSQASQDTSRRFGGTGLGLTICKQLLQLQGGDITVQSTVGEGSQFRFHLPFGINHTPAIEAPIQTGKTEHEYPLARANRYWLLKTMK